jgi:hypothetical protein
MNTAVIWLFRPFERLSGRQTLLAGLGLILLVAAVAKAAGLETDAVLSLHFADAVGLGALIVQGLVNWLVMVACLLLAARLLDVRSLSLTALAGHQALARWPLLLAAIYMSIPPVNERMRQLTTDLVAVMPSQPGLVMADAAYMADAFILTAFGLPVLVTLVWMALLMLHGFSVATGLKGPKAVFPFAAGLLVAHLVSLGLNFLIG